MPRFLTMHRTIVPQSDRKRYVERMRDKREYYARANCRFYVFEEAQLKGAFLEFFEADDLDTLANAHARAPESLVDPARIYREVELK